MFLSDAAIILFILLMIRNQPPPQFPILMPEQAQSLENGGWFEVALIAMVASLHAYGHYRRRIPFWTEACQVASAGLIGLICSFVILHIMDHLGNRLRLFLLLVWICIPPAIIAARMGARRLLAWARLWQIRTLIAGDAAATERVSRALLSDSSLGYQHAGDIAIATLAASGVRAALAQAGADFLVIAPGAGDEQHLQRINADLALRGVEFAVVLTQVAGAPVARPQPQYFINHNLMMVACGNRLDDPAARLTKTAFDLALSSVLLLLALPALAVIALLVRADGGPAFYSHTRIGANGRRFACLKFRSMVRDADAVLQRTLASDPAAAAEWRANRKLARDPRITWIGRILRRTSLDELPQLLNVLRGEMSLVGPRPIVEDEIAQYGTAIEYYYRIKPGVTGLWQVSGRSNTSYPQRVEMDTWYVKNWTLGHDVAILFRTVTAVLGARGAR